MHLYKMCVSKDNAWKTMNQLGSTGLTHFIDINKDILPYKLPYTLLLKRMDTVLRKIE